LNPLDYSIWNELVNAIKWDKVKSKTTLIQQLKSSIKNIHESVVLKDVLVGPIDRIAFLNMMESIYVNKKKTVAQSLKWRVF